jgi:hypothetical protein
MQTLILIIIWLLSVILLIAIAVYWIVNRKPYRVVKQIEGLEQDYNFVVVNTDTKDCYTGTCTKRGAELICMELNKNRKVKMAKQLKKAVGIKDNFNNRNYV